jgi:hypothetical protein
MEHRMSSDLSVEQTHAEQTTIKISRLRTIPISQDLILGKEEITRLNIVSFKRSSVTILYG